MKKKYVYYDCNVDTKLMISWGLAQFPRSLEKIKAYSSAISFQDLIFTN